jgi:GMP synthase-like glutamine amidotransferase
MADRPLRIRVFQHVPFEDIGSLAAWARERGHDVAYTRFHAGEAAPDPSAYDFLIVMGGPMGVHDGDRLPWLGGEKRALRAALDAGRSVLGICLGAQLIADVLGAPVTRNPQAEIGWFPVELAPAARDSWISEIFPGSFPAFHWHGDTFAIPAGYVPLGSSAACRNQGFLGGMRANVLGLQFHPEATAESVASLAEACADELRPAPFVQDGEALRAGVRHAPALNAMLGRACDRLAAAASRPELAA